MSCYRTGERAKWQINSLTAWSRCLVVLWWWYFQGPAVPHSLSFFLFFFCIYFLHKVDLPDLSYLDATVGEEKPSRRRQSPYGPQEEDEASQQCTCVVLKDDWKVWPQECPVLSAVKMVLVHLMGVVRKERGKKSRSRARGLIQPTTS